MARPRRPRRSPTRCSRCGPQRLQQHVARDRRHRTSETRRSDSWRATSSHRFALSCRSTRPSRAMPALLTSTSPPAPQLRAATASGKKVADRPPRPTTSHGRRQCTDAMLRGRISERLLGRLRPLAVRTSAAAAPSAAKRDGMTPGRCRAIRRSPRRRGRSRLNSSMSESELVQRPARNAPRRRPEDAILHTRSPPADAQRPRRAITRRATTAGNRAAAGHRCSPGTSGSPRAGCGRSLDAARASAGIRPCRNRPSAAMTLRPPDTA